MAPLFTGFRFGFGRGAAAETGGAVNATGGTQTTYGSRTIHTFTNVGDATFTLENGNLPAVPIMVVAGGGSGGSRHGGAGGGGSGGGAFYPNFNLGTNPYTIVIGAGGGAGVVRIHGTEKAVAASVDSSATYCFAHPLTGGKQVVCESWRNLISVGAEPIAITNCLNFGNPEKEKLMIEQKLVLVITKNIILVYLLFSN